MEKDVALLIQSYYFAQAYGAEAYGTGTYNCNTTSGDCTTPTPNPGDGSNPGTNPTDPGTGTAVPTTPNTGNLIFEPSVAIPGSLALAIIFAVIITGITKFARNRTQSKSSS